MKLIVQIPCLNEAETLPAVVRGIPRVIDGIDVVEVMVLDDGSTDGTSEVAAALGVDHIQRNVSNIGLARSFQRALEAGLAAGADIIVNIDGDNQYAGSSIPDLVRPIIDGKADIVVGDRRPGKNEDFSATKRLLQRVGSAVVRMLSRVDVADAVSGFRAYSRDAALRTTVITTFSYTTETLIHAGRTGLTVASVPVETNRVERPSRLFKSMPQFLRRQGLTMLRAFTMYSPLRVFGALGLVMGLLGTVPIVRFLYFYAIGEGDGHVQSLMLGAMFFALGYVTVVIALLSDTIATNRQLLEHTLTRLRQIDLRLNEQEAASKEEAGSELEDTRHAPQAFRGAAE